MSVRRSWETSVRWVTWVWRGEVTRVIEELVARQQVLGLPMRTWPVMRTTSAISARLFDRA